MTRPEKILSITGLLLTAVLVYINRKPKIVNAVSTTTGTVETVWVNGEDANSPYSDINVFMNNTQEGFYDLYLVAVSNGISKTIFSMPSLSNGTYKNFVIEPKLYDKILVKYSSGNPAAITLKVANQLGTTDYGGVKSAGQYEFLNVNLQGELIIEAV